MANKFNFGKVLRNMQSIDISLDLANTAKNDFLNNFRTESFDGKSWKQRKNDKTPGRKLLVKSGRLRRDVSNSVSAGHKNGRFSYTLIVKNPYAGYNNDGAGALPKRQFVGMTRELNKKLLNKINQRIKSIWAT